MVNTKNKEFDHDRFDELVDELNGLGCPFIVVMKDTEGEKVHSMGNMDEFENGLLLMADILRRVANRLVDIDEGKDYGDKED